MFITQPGAKLPTCFEGVQAGALLESLFQRETTLNSSGGFLISLFDRRKLTSAISCPVRSPVRIEAFNIFPNNIGNHADINADVFSDQSLNIISRAALDIAATANRNYVCRLFVLPMVVIKGVFAAINALQVRRFGQVLVFHHPADLGADSASCFSQNPPAVIRAIRKVSPSNVGYLSIANEALAVDAIGLVKPFALPANVTLSPVFFTALRAGSGFVQSHLSGPLLGSAQIRPINIGPEFFASNSAVRGTLYRWAAVCRNLARAPVGNRLRGFAKQFTQRGKASDGGNGFIDLVNLFHIDTLHTMFRKVNHHV